MSESDIPGALRRLIQRNPALWIGAGVSRQADPPLPTLWQLAVGLREGLGWDPLPEVDDPYSLFDQGLNEGIFQPGDLHDYLELKLRPGGRDPKPGALHRQIAEMAADDVFPFIVDTNYDLLLRRAMQDINAAHTHSVLQQNLSRPSQGCWYLSIHGDMSDWSRIVLTKASYRHFDMHYRFLRGQLDLLLTKHPVLFVGCSMTDPRLLDWIDGLDADARAQLKTWVAVLGPGELEQLNYKMYNGRSIRAVLGQHLSLVEVPSFSLLPKWFSTLAAPARLRRQRAARQLTVEVHANHGTWSLEVAGQTLQIANFDPGSALSRLRSLAGRGLPCDETGVLLEASDAAAEREMMSTAREVGARITALLPEAGRTAIAELAGSSAVHGDGLVRIRVSGPAANAALLLPWELLMVEDRFPVACGELSVTREAVAAGVEEGLPTPPPELSVVAHVSAPVHSDLPELNLEEAAFRMARALVHVEDRTLFTDLGTLEDLERGIERLAPVLLHFSGHAVPGNLIFEDNLGGPTKVSTDRLLEVLRRAMHKLPSAIWLSCCYGSGVGANEPFSSERAREWGAGDPEAPSIAAELHRAGVPQVLGYFGPVPDALAVEVDRSLFEALVKTQSTIAACRAARLRTRRAVETGHGWSLFPLAWSLLGLYHRGANVPLALSPAATTPPHALARALEREPEDLHGLESLRHGFIGRRRLLALMRQHREHGLNVLGLWGLGGLGKTATMIRLAKIFSGGGAGWQQRVVVLSLKNIDRNFAALRDAVEHAARTQQGCPNDLDVRLRRIEQVEGDRGGPLAGVLLDLLRDRVLYVDNAESLQVDPSAGAAQQAGVPWCDAEVTSFFTTLCRDAPSRSTILLTTRYRPADTPGTWVAIEPCSRDEIFRMMRWFPSLQSLPPELRVELAESRLGGHPRAVEWANVLIGELAARYREDGYQWEDATNYDFVRTKILEPALVGVRENVGPDLLLEAIIDLLPSKPRLLLGECCGIGLPVPVGTIQDLGEGSEVLRARGLLTRFEGQEWGLHPFVREVVERRGQGWTTGGRGILADYWLLCCRREGGAPMRVWKEALEHLTAAERWMDAREVVTEIERGYHTHGLVRGRVDFFARLEGSSWPRAERGFILHRSANALLAVDRLDEAEARARAAIELAELPSELCSALHGLANVLVRKGEYPEAEATFRRCISMHDDMYTGQEHADMAAPIHGLASVLMKLGRYEEAEQAERRAITLQERVFNTRKHDDIASSLLGLANILKRQKRYDEAERTFREAIDIWKDLHETHMHPLVAVALDGLAQLLALQGKHQEAEPIYLEAISLKEKMYETSEHASVAASLTGLGGALNAQGRFAEAQEILQRALAIQRRLYKPDHPDIAATLNGLGMLFLNCERFDEAAECFCEEVEIETALMGTRRHPSIIPSLNRLAQVLAMGNRPSEAREYAHDAWEGALDALNLRLAVECGPIYIAVLVMLGCDFEADWTDTLLSILVHQLPQDDPLRAETERYMRGQSTAARASRTSNWSSSSSSPTGLAGRRRRLRRR